MENSAHLLFIHLPTYHLYSQSFIPLHTDLCILLLLQHPPIQLPSTCPRIHLSTCPSIDLSSICIYLFKHPLTECPFVHPLSNHLFIHPYTHPLIYQPSIAICLNIHPLSVRLSILSSIYPCTDPAFIQPCFSPTHLFTYLSSRYLLPLYASPASQHCFFLGVSSSPAQRTWSLALSSDQGKCYTTTLPSLPLCLLKS